MLQDIHFKSTPLTSPNPLASSSSNPIPGSYKDFVLLHLPQIHILDGIQLQSSHRQKATLTYADVIGHYNSSLATLESSYQKEISVLLNAQQVNHLIAIDVHYIIDNLMTISETRGLSVSI